MVVQNPTQKDELEEQSCYQRLLEDAAATEAKLHTALEQNLKVMNMIFEQRKAADSRIKKAETKIEEMQKILTGQAFLVERLHRNQLTAKQSRNGISTSTCIFLQLLHVMH